MPYNREPKSNERKDPIEDSGKGALPNKPNNSSNDCEDVVPVNEEANQDSSNKVDGRANYESKKQPDEGDIG